MSVILWHSSHWWDQSLLHLEFGYTSVIRNEEDVAYGTFDLQGWVRWGHVTLNLSLRLPNLCFRRSPSPSEKWDIDPTVCSGEDGWRPQHSQPAQEQIADAWLSNLEWLSRQGFLGNSLGRHSNATTRDTFMFQLLSPAFPNSWPSKCEESNRIVV